MNFTRGSSWGGFMHCCSEEEPQLMHNQAQFFCGINDMFSDMFLIFNLIICFLEVKLKNPCKPWLRVMKESHTAWLNISPYGDQRVSLSQHCWKSQLYSDFIRSEQFITSFITLTSFTRTIIFDHFSLKKERSCLPCSVSDRAESWRLCSTLALFSKWRPAETPVIALMMRLASQ